MTGPLKFDGERFTPESVREIWYEHMHRYAFATQLVNGLNVLDAACGEGYGSAMLATSAESVVGVDVSSEAVEHARHRYSGNNLDFEQSDCCRLPFDAGHFDCVVSFETIEHLESQAEMLAEFRRVLNPGGFLLISSPDKAIYSDEQGFDNPHHVRELYRAEFQALLDEHFSVTRMFGQKLQFYSAIWPLAGEGETGSADVLNARLQNHSEGEVRNVSRPVQPPMYLLAICAESEGALPAMQDAVWLFDDLEESVYRHYQHEIRKNMQAGGILAERDAELERLRSALGEAQASAPAKNESSLLERLGFKKRR